MSLLINCQNISKSFGLVPVFSGIQFSVNERDRIGIIGPNGAGKSTLLRILAGQDQPDTGIVSMRRGLRASYVEQHQEFAPGQSVREVLMASLARTSHAHELGRVESVIGRAGFADPEAQAHALSGGWKKRLAICEQLITDPELLLLDEPTNHLDLDGIEWLEELIASAPYAVCVISHDRYFLEAVATSIMEVNRIYPSGIFATAGGYGKFMEHKALFVEGQASTMASMANKLRYETEWLRRGAQARSTKQQARIKSAGALKQDLESTEQRTRRLAVEFDFSASQRKSKLLIQVEHLKKSFGDRTLFENLSFTLGPQMRLGLIGPNGSGKSTLIKSLMKSIPSDSGTVVHADKLQVVYYDQHREQLPSGITLRRALAPDSDSVAFQSRSIHVSSYARNFGFRTEQLDTDVTKLSGGERARLLLARMLLRPADVLILDEPTNDLDIDTLEMLEQSLLSFPGAVVLVTHDRYLMDRVCNGMLGLMGGATSTFFADYAQYAIALTAQRAEENKPTSKAEKSTPAPARKTSGRKLSYNDQRDWDTMEERIVVAEDTLAKAQATASDPTIAASSIKVQDAYKAIETAQDAVDKLYARWTELEDRIKGLES